MAFVDRPLSDYLHGIDVRHPAVIDFFRAYTDLGRSLWYLWPSGAGTFICLLLIYFEKFPPARREQRLRLGQALGFFFACVATSGIVTDIIKPIVGRARPVMLARDGFYGFEPLTFHAAANSFPSGHATTAFAVATALILLRPRWRPWLLAFAVALSLSRIMVNAHFLSDVTAGAVVGVLTTLALRNMFRRYGIFPIDSPAGSR